MSLAIIACDSAQAIAISDGRVWSEAPEKRFLRDDMSKVYQIAPRIYVATTGQGTLLLVLAVQAFIASKSGAGEFSPSLQDIIFFSGDWLRKEARHKDIAAVFFGWDERQRRMRVLTYIHGDPVELFQPPSHLPIHVAVGLTESLGTLDPETFAVKNPMQKMREVMAFASSKSPDIGGRTFEFLAQAPPHEIGEIGTGRVWPTFNADEFDSRLNANPPATINELLLTAYGELARRNALKQTQREK